MKSMAPSIRHKVILLVCGLTLAGAVASSWMTYVELRRAALATARERLASVTDQLGGLLATQMAGLRAEMATLAATPTVLDFVREPGPQTRSAALAVLDSVVAETDSPSLLELRGADEQRLLSTGDSSLAPVDLGVGDLADALSATDSAIIAPLRPLSEDRVVIGSAAPIASDSEVVGYVVQRSIIDGGEEQAASLRELIGPGSALLVGNADLDVWTDLTRGVAGPPIEAPPAEDTLLQYARDGSSWSIAAIQRIPGAPWVVLVEFPRAPVIAGAQQVALRLAMIMGLLAAIGTAAAWMLSNRLIRPLGEAADAAGDIARGDYARRLAVRGDDEVSELAEAFNAMAERVQESKERLEQRVQERTAELRAVNEELEAFSYSVSHDLRAPLRSIDGFCQALLEDAEDDLDEASQGHLQRVRAASQRMAQLIDDLLELSRVTRAEMRRQPTDLTAIANEIVEELVDGRTDDRAGRAEVVIQPRLEAVGDRRLLRVALENLIGNAWKFTGRQERPRIEVGSERDDERTVFYVRDNGAGFDMKYAGQLFAPFQRLHSGSEFEGTGIGLATVQRIVHRHGGRVWANGTVDEGATIRFTLNDANRPEVDDG